MEDIVLFKHVWKWLLSEETHYYSGTAMKCFKKIGILIGRHWPRVCHVCWRLVKLLGCFLIEWKKCLVRGSGSLFGLGTAALFVIIWSCFLTLTSMSTLFFLLLSMVCFLFFILNLCLESKNYILLDFMSLKSCRYRFRGVWLFFFFLVESDYLIIAFLSRTLLVYSD